MKCFWNKKFSERTQNTNCMSVVWHLGFYLQMSGLLKALRQFQTVATDTCSHTWPFEGYWASRSHFLTWYSSVHSGRWMKHLVRRFPSTLGTGQGSRGYSLPSQHNSTHLASVSGQEKWVCKPFCLCCCWKTVEMRWGVKVIGISGIHFLSCLHVLWCCLCRITIQSRGI